MSSLSSPTQESAYSQVNTPSGIEVRYQDAPERKYELRRPGMTNEQWFEVPSVTTVLDILNKPALPWWGMETGVKGMLQLQHYPDVSWDLLKISDPAAIVKLLTKHKLTVNHVRDEAGKRGHSVHAALEGWAETGTIPDPDIFPHEEKGYVQGLVKFLRDIPDAEVISYEQMVGSLEHGYAGRFDLRIKLPKDRNVVYKHTPKRGEKWATVDEGEYIIDLKTSKRVYLSHHRQLAGYELASVECGYPPATATAILHVRDDGSYEFVRGLAEAEAFVVVLDLYKSEQQLKEKK